MRMPGSMFRVVVGCAAVSIALGCARELPTDANQFSVRDARATGGATKTDGIVVSSAMPNAAKRGTTINVRIFGSNFDRSVTARWGIDSVVTSDVIVNSTTYVSTTEVVANITVKSDAQLTQYDIIIQSTKSGKPGIGTESFEVVETLDLGTLGGAYSAAISINDVGQIVGFSSYVASRTVNGLDHPVLWESSGLIRDLLPTGYSMGRALDINESGQVVGWAVKSSNNYIVPFVWTSATGFRELATLAGVNNSGAWAINDAGVIAGYSGASSVIWENGVLRVIHTVAGQWGGATDINNAGEVVGNFSPKEGSGPYQSYIWRASSGAQLLPALNGTIGSVTGINDNGTIVGTGPLPGDTTNYAYIIEGGVVRRLSSPALRGTVVRGISESGYVLGTDAAGRGIMWTPAGVETLICVPPVSATGYYASCAPFQANTAGAAVGLRTDKYGQTTKAYRWTLPTQ